MPIGWHRFRIFSRVWMPSPLGDAIFPLLCRRSESRSSSLGEMNNGKTRKNAFLASSPARLALFGSLPWASATISEKLISLAMIRGRVFVFLFFLLVSILIHVPSAMRQSINVYGMIISPWCNTKLLSPWSSSVTYDTFFLSQNFPPPSSLSHSHALSFSLSPSLPFPPSLLLVRSRALTRLLTIVLLTLTPYFPLFFISFPP